MRNHTVVSFFWRCSALIPAPPARSLRLNPGIDVSVKPLVFCAIVAAAGPALGVCALADTLGHRAGAVAHDAFIYTAVRGHLVDVDVDSASAVYVAVDHGVVTLSGQARSAVERARYVAAAESVSGVTSVRDDIAVNPQLRGPSETTRDGALAVRIYAALVAQSGVNAFRVTVKVRDGFVTLTGSVPSAAVERTIATTAQGVQGVRGVVNRLTLSGS
jgi:hyperosmotically inducible periplasmic protein